MKVYRDESFNERIEKATGKKPKARGAMANVRAANNPKKTLKGLLNECSPSKKK